MPNIIRIKRKTTTGAPAIANLAIGELCINTVDNVLYIKRDAANLESINLGTTPGVGDMLVAVYDTNSDGKVNAADNADSLGGVAAASYALRSYVDSAISALVNGAAGALDTLNELATALGNDPNFATTITTALGTKLDANSTVDGGEITA